MNTTTYVYAITQYRGELKIGYSRNPESRRRSIEKETGFATRVLLKYRCNQYARGLEKALHTIFAEFRIGKSEWFTTIQCVDVWNAIKKIEMEGPIPEIILPHKTAKEYARDVMHDLPAGRLLRANSGQPATTEIGSRDFLFYNVRSSKTQQKIMNELASKGVVSKRPNRAALVSDPYQYKPAKN